MGFERDLPTFLDRSIQLLDASPDAIYTLDYTKHNPTRSSVTARVQDDRLGVCLKFKTDKVHELGRLLVGSARLSQRMAGMDDAAWQAQVTALTPAAAVTGDGAVTVTEDVAMKEVNTDAAATTGASKKKKKKGKK